MKQAITITLSEPERQALMQVIKGHSSRKDHIQRARMILACAKGYSNLMVGTELKENNQTVGKWRNRWAQAALELRHIQQSKDTSITLKERILQLLSDAPRSGGPPKFTMEQVCQIYSVATETPESCGIPLSHWSLTSLAQELVKRKIVESISTSHLNFFLKSRVIETT